MNRDRNRLDFELLRATLQRHDEGIVTPELTPDERARIEGAIRAARRHASPSSRGSRIALVAAFSAAALTIVAFVVSRRSAAPAPAPRPRQALVAAARPSRIEFTTASGLRIIWFTDPVDGGL